MAEIVTASLTINFDAGKGSNQFLVEVDDRENGPNGGRSSFNPGDTVYLLLYASDNISQIRQFVTSGSLAQGGTVIVDKEEIISFAQEREASARYPVMPGSASYEWYGPSPGVITVSGGKFIASTDAFAIGKAKYRSRATQYVLSGVSYPAALALFTGVAS